MCELIEKYYLPHKTGRKRMPVIYNAIGKRDLFLWHKRIYYVGRLNCFQKANWFAKKQFFCIASNSTRNSLIFLFYPIHELYRVEHTFTAVKRKNLRRFKLSKRLTRKYAKLLSIILRPKVTPVYVTSCESCKQASNNDSISIPG